VLGVGAYLVGLGLPVGWRVPLLALGLGLLLQLVLETRDRERVPVSSRAGFSWIVVAFMASFAMSTLVSVDRTRSMTLAVAVLPGLLCLVALQGVRPGRAERRVLGVAGWITSTVAGASVVTAALMHPGESPFALATHAGVAAIVVPNDVVLLAVLSPISVVLLRDGAAWKRVAGGLGLALTVAAVGMLASRIACLTLLVVLGTSLALLQPRLAVAGIVVAAVSVLVVDGVLGWPILAKLAGPVDPRLSLWAVEWRFFTDAPVLGHGPFTLAADYEPTIAQLSLPAWLTRDPQATVPWAHSLWFEALGERGVVGLATLALLAGSSLRAALRRARSRTSFDGRHVVPLAALIGLCVASLFELTLLHEWVGVVLFALAAIVHAPDPDPSTGGS
jgi:hypothetical protein